MTTVSSALLALSACLPSPTQQADVVLEASFNRKATQATSPKGHVDADGPPGTPFTYPEGIFATGILLAESALAYPAAGHVDPNNGSLSVWIKPLDWGNRAERFVPIWTLIRGNGWMYVLYYVKGHLSFRSMFEGKQLTITESASLRQGKLAQNTWTHVVLTWNTMGLRLYLDGKPVGDVSYGLPIHQPALQPGHRLLFFPTFFWSGKRQHNTVLDELLVFSRALNKDDVRELYHRFAATRTGALRPAVLPVPRASRPVTIDGRLDPNEWADATQVPLMKVLPTQQLAGLRAWFFVKYNAEFLYVGSDVRHRKPLNVPSQTTGPNVFRGDLVEFDCRRPGDSPDHYCQFGVAPNGHHAHHKNGDWNWQADVRCAAHREPNRWTAEMAIPLGAVGYDPKVGWIEANVGMHRPNEDGLGGAFERWLCWSTGRRQFVDCMGVLKFMPDATAVQVHELGDVLYGRVKLRLAGTPAGKLRADVRMAPAQGTGGLARQMTLRPDGERVTASLGWKGSGTLSIQAFATGSDSPVFDYHTRLYVRDPFDFTFTCDARQRVLHLQADLMGLKDRHAPEVRQGKVVLRASLTDDRAKVYGQVRVVAKGYDPHLSIPFTELPLGTYTVTAAVQAGSTRYEKRRSLQRPSPVFLQDRTGLGRDVPAPWVPIQQHGHTVTLLNREYTFGRGPFPQHATSRGVPVLARQAALTVTCAGKTFGFEPVTCIPTEIAPDRLVSAGTCESSRAGLRLRWRRRIDYDGLVRCDLLLEPIGKSVSIDALHLDVPVPHVAATYALTPTYNHAWTTNARATVSGFPLVWLTNDRAGLCLFTDTDANWVYPDKTKPISVVKQKTHALIRAAIISSPVTIDRPTSYVFGLMATPGKPPRADYRAIHAEGWSSPKGQTLQTRGWNCDRNSLWWENQHVLTRLRTPGKARQELARYRNKGIACVPYTCANCMPDNNPLYDYYGLRWQRTVGGRVAPKVCRTEYQGKAWYLASTCAASGFADYLTYYTAQYMRQGEFAGLYLDFGGPARCDSARHGCRRTDVLRPKRIPVSYNVFAFRAMYERLYKIIHKHKPAGYLYGHSWDTFWPPVVSFVDVVNPGEEFMHTAPKRPETYIDDVPLEKWQSNYSSQVIGAGVQFLGQCNSGVRGILQMKEELKLERSRPLLTCCLLHDIPCGGGMYTSVERVWSILDQNNVTRAEFAPYWRQSHVRTNHPKVLVSYYHWPREERFLLLVGNWTAEPQSVRLQFHDLDVTHATTTPTDAETGRVVDLAQPVRVVGRGFRIVGVRCR